jgi:hypothetical protein
VSLIDGRTFSSFARRKHRVEAHGPLPPTFTARGTMKKQKKKPPKSFLVSTSSSHQVALGRPQYNSHGEHKSICLWPPANFNQ